MKQRIEKLFQGWFFPLVCAVILALLINRFVFFKVTVPTGSMLPTIKLGDQLIVTRIYNVNNLKRGDIIVFKSEELRKVLVKRLIGLPGESIDIDSKGIVSVNGKKIEEPYVVYSEGFAGHFKVPAKSFLFFGDNRADSLDARKWFDPYIPAEKIMGKAQIVVYPFDRFGRIVSGVEALKHGK